MPRRHLMLHHEHDTSQRCKPREASSGWAVSPGEAKSGVTEARQFIRRSEGGAMRKVLALVLALVVGGGTAVSVTASRAGASSEFTLLVHTTNFEFVNAHGASSVASLPFAPGDRIVDRNDLTESGRPVGYSMEVCTVTFNDNLMCDEIYSLTNQGDLHTSTLIRGLPAVWDLIVDGGTFAFRNAHGSAHVVILPNHDGMVTFALG